MKHACGLRSRQPELKCYLFVSLLLLLATTICIACGQEPPYLDVSSNNALPPTFHFSGTSVGKFFEVQELPVTKPLSRTNGFTRTGTTIWKISPPQQMKADNWPRFKYGEVPSGFTQTVPVDNAPPKLVEGKLYLARIVGDTESDSAFFFEVRANRITNVTDKVFGP